MTSKGPRKDKEERDYEKRELIILETIQSNPNLHHNALKEIITPRFMAKKTYDKIIKNLRNNKTIVPEKDGNKKLYSLAQGFPEDTIKENLSYLNDEITKLKKELMYLQKHYAKFSKEKKIQLTFDISNAYREVRNNIFKMRRTMGKKPPVEVY